MAWLIDEHAGVTVFVCVDVEVESECVIFLSMIITALSDPPAALRLITAACTCGYRDDDNTLPD